MITEAVFITVQNLEKICCPTMDMWISGNTLLHLWHQKSIKVKGIYRTHWAYRRGIRGRE